MISKLNRTIGNPMLLPATALLMAVIAVMALPAGLSAQAPVGVSPGSVGSPTELGTSCPTFSWSGVDGATGYELVVYGVARDGLQLGFRMPIPGDARSWTPAASACPEAGSQYAWTVRASTAEGEGAWSEPLLFTTPDTPTEDEVRRALETLRRYRMGALRSGPGLDAASGEGDEGPSREPAAAETSRSRPVPGGPTADQSPTVAPRSGVAPLTAPSVGASPAPRDVVAPGEYALSIDGDMELGGAIFREGYPFLHNDGGSAFGNVGLGLLAMISLTPGEPDASSGAENSALGGRALRDLTSGAENTAVGFDALQQTTTGSVNTAVGSRALSSNTSGSSNTAVGSRAAFANSTGEQNTAVGFAALYSASNAFDNTAVGYRALVLATSGLNTAVGSLALTATTTGGSNTAVGLSALKNNTTGEGNTAVGTIAMYYSLGSYNTAIGLGAGSGWGSGSDNIAIGTGTNGSGGDDGVIRIGGQDKQTSTYIEGIFGATASGGSQVFINSSNQLGTSTSSARFKQDVQDIEGRSERLLALRPVSFRYRSELVGLEGEQNPLEYGLIAEEVAEIFPELVIYDDQGEPFSVRYHLLTPLLLDELQRQHRALQHLHELVQAQSRSRGSH